MSKNPKKMTKHIRRVLCYTLAVFLFATISVMAQTAQGTVCSSHTEHTEDCGYAEAAAAVACDMECSDTVNGEVVHKEDCAYSEAVEAADCTHSCELCDPEEGAETAQSADSTDSAASADEAATEDASASATSSDATSAADTAATSDEAASEDEAATDATTDEESAAATLSSIATLDSSSNVYNISIGTKETTLTDEQDTINLVSETTGILAVSVDLSSGETGRYIDIYLTDYGMTFTSTLPSADGNITSVETRTTTVDLGNGVTNTVSYLRLYVSDSIEDTLSIDVNYTTQTISDAIDALWGSTGTLPETGFKVILYSSAGEVLSSADYGEWVPENVETTPAFTVTSGYNSYITNYPDLSSYYDDTHRYKNGRWYMQISFDNLYSSGDVRRENLESVRIYVPDPTTLAEVTSITVERSTSGVTLPIFTESFDSSTTQIQQDGDKYYYEFEFSNTDAAYKTDYSGYIYIYVVLKKADDSEAEPGDELGTYEMQLVTRSYGNEDTNTYTTEYTPTMRSETVITETYTSEQYGNGYYVYRYYGGAGTPTTSTVSSVSSAHTVEPGTTGSSDVIGQYQVSGVLNQYLDGYSTAAREGFHHQYSAYTDYVWPTLEGSKETWKFPYEIQPTQLTYYLGVGNYQLTSETFASVMEQAGVSNSNINEVLKVTYTTSQSNTYDASISYDGQYLYVDFDQPLEEDEYITSATTEWLSWVEYATSFTVSLTYDVPEAHEDGSEMVAEEKFQVEHLWQDAEDNTISDSTQSQSWTTHIWFMVGQSYCPQLTWIGEDDNELVFMSNDDKYTSTYTLQVDSTHDNASGYMDTVDNPKIKLAVGLRGSSSLAWDGWYDSSTALFLTGRMTVMPFLAGWTITYKTEFNGDREQIFTIPDEISEDGLEINLLSDGDRFTSVLVFSYEGEVDGWSNCPELIKDVEYAFWRTDITGENSIIADAIYPSYAKGYNMAAVLYAYFCSESCSGTDGSSDHIGSSSNIYDITQSAHTYAGIVLKNFIYNAVLQFSLSDSSYTSVNMENIYQGDTAQLSISFEHSITWVGASQYGLGSLVQTLYGGSNSSSGSNWSNSYTYASTFFNKHYETNGSSNYVQAPYESSPTFYVELLTDDVTYYFDAITATFGNPTVETSAGVEIVYGNDDSAWLKITPDTTAATVGINSQSISYYYRMWSTMETFLYALPSAETGTREIIGDVYLDLHVQELTSRFDGTDATYPYLVYEFEDLVADTRNVLGTGDTDTECLYLIDTGASATVSSYTISGVQIYPGASDGLATETRAVDIYNHDANNLTALISISGASSTLSNYTSTIYLPRADTSVDGTLPNDSSATSYTSSVSMYLTDEPSVSGTSSTGLTITYSTNGGSSFVSASEIDNWSEVDAIRVEMDELEQGTALSITLSMCMDEQTKEMDGKSSYLGCDYEFTLTSSDGETSTAIGSATLATYTFNLYELSGVVWYDPNENGARSGDSEVGIEGVTLAIKRSSDDSTVDTVTTGENGEFSIKLAEGEGLYIEINLPEGYKLTARGTAASITSSATDSDFDRTTNTVTLPDILRDGAYENISAGLVKLPVIDVSEVTVVVDQTTSVGATAEWDYGEAVINYGASDDPTVATVNSDDGTVTGVTKGTTEAVVWVQNTLGDRVEATYTINVVENPVSFTLRMQLSEAAYSDETFVFKVTDGNNNSFYVTLTVAQGETSASVQVVDLAPGNYTVTELDTNWRYSTSSSQNQTLSDESEPYSFTFTSEKTNNYWVSDNDKVTNTMQSTG